MNSTEYWYPWYPVIFKSNTLNLTPEQDGLYRRLIDHYMETREPLPDSDAALARICGVSIECFMDASCMLRAYFKQKDGMLHHDFCNRILDEQDARSKKRAMIAKKASKKRWSQNIDKKEENASCMHEGMHNDAIRQDKTGKDKINNLLNPSDGFEIFWGKYPRQRIGNKSKAEAAWKKALTRATAREILDGLEKYRGSSEVSSGYAKGAAAWLNDDRWTSEYRKPGEQVRIADNSDMEKQIAILRGNK